MNKRTLLFIITILLSILISTLIVIPAFLAFYLNNGLYLLLYIFIAYPYKVLQLVLRKLIIKLQN